MNKRFGLLSTLILGLVLGAALPLSVQHYANEAEVLADVGTYYNGINDSSGSATLLSGLRTLNSTKRTSTVGYPNMGDHYPETDGDPGNSGNLIAFYSGTSASFSGSFTGNFNREHVWPNSRGGSAVEADIHMTRPALAAENGSRGNSFYVEGMASSTNGWDPAAEDFGLEKYRGISARVIFYCVIASSSLSLVDLTNDDTGNNTMGKLSTLLDWNLRYGIDSTETQRNEAAQTIQGNRNPFIDHPEYACKIWGGYNSATETICASSQTEPTSISVSPSSASIGVNGTQSLSVSALPSGASTSVSWSTSNSNVATVDGGTVTGVSAGTATITATSTLNSGITDTCDITVTNTSVAVTGVTIASTASVAAGATTTLTPTISPANATNKTVSWLSGTTGVATINSSTGLITGVSAGTSTITVTTADGGYTDTCQLTVIVTGEPALINSYDFLDGGSGSNNAYANVNLATNVSYAADNPGGTSGTTAWEADYANLSLTAGTRIGGKLVSAVQTDNTTAWANIKTTFTFSPIIEKVEILGVATFGTAGNTTALYLQSSTTGTTWTTQSTTTSKSGTITFDSMTIPATSYLRFGIALTASSTNSGIAFTGIRVYQQEGVSKTLSSIAVTTQPTNKSYYNGDSFNPAGMVVTATYSDSSTANVTASCTYTPTPLTTGTTSVTVHYTEGTEKTTTVTGITVAAAKTLSSIAVTTQPSDKSYNNGESFNPAGMVVTATYSDSTTANVTSSCTYTPDPLTTGTTSVAASYTEGGVTRTANITGITVTALTLQSISIKTAASATMFSLGDTFSSSGLVITAHYSDSSTADLSSGFTVTGVDTAKLGHHTATITYNDKTTSYSVVVSNNGASVGSPSGNASDLFISEYIEGSSSNKALEIYNGTGSAVALSAYSMKLYSNGSSTASNTLTLSGTLASGGVYAIANSAANATIIGLCNVTNAVTNFNGNDAVGLYKNDVLIDIIGVIGENPAAWTGTGANSVSGSTANMTLVRTSSTSAPNATFTWSEWNAYTLDTTTYLGAHTYAGSGQSGNVTNNQQAIAWADYFIECTTGTCEDLTGAFGSYWNDLASEYGYMVSGSKNAFCGNSPSSAAITNAIARYTHIVQKYGMSDFVVDGNGDGLASLAASKLPTNDDSSYAIVVIAIAITLASAFAFALSKKKKFD